MGCTLLHRYTISESTSGGSRFQPDKVPRGAPVGLVCPTVMDFGAALTAEHHRFDNRLPVSRSLRNTVPTRCPPPRQDPTSVIVRTIRFAYTYVLTNKFSSVQVLPTRL